MLDGLNGTALPSGVRDNAAQSSSNDEISNRIIVAKCADKFGHNYMYRPGPLFGVPGERVPGHGSSQQYERNVSSRADFTVKVITFLYASVRDHASPFNATTGVFKQLYCVLS